jgi:hypothetical protein
MEAVRKMKGMLYVLYVSIALAASLLAIGVIVFRSWTGKNGKEGAEKFRIKDTLLLRMIHLTIYVFVLLYTLCNYPVVSNLCYNRMSFGI